MLQGPCSLLGFQLYPAKSNRLNGLYSLLVVCGVLYVFSQMDPYNVEGGGQWMAEHFKPLVGLLMRTEGIYIQPIAFLLYASYFKVYGRTIVQLLDEDTFGTIYRTFGNEKYICIGTLLVYTLSYVLRHFQHIVMERSEVQGLLGKVLGLLCIFLVHHQQCFTLGTLHYGKLATYHALRDLRCDLDTNTTIGTVLQSHSIE